MLTWLIDQAPAMVMLIGGIAFVFIVLRLIIRVIRNTIVHNMKLYTRVELCDGNTGELVAHLPEKMLEVKLDSGKFIYVKEWGVQNVLNKK